MRALVRDAEFKGLFAVLMIVRLDHDAVTAGAWVYDPQGMERGIDLEMNIERQF
jgi:hypothetical protein